MQVSTEVSPLYANADLIELAARVSPYVSSLATVAMTRDYMAPECSLCLPDDEPVRAAVETLVQEKVSDALRYIFVVGIGGSNLGTKAIYDALIGYQEPVPVGRPQLIFIDAVNTRYLTYVCEQVVPQLQTPAEYLVVTISKSGGTTETLANTEILLAALATHVGDPAARTVVITDEGSAYATAAQAQGVAVLTMPPRVGGRYSVFSAVGLFPLAAAGVDVVALREGARALRDICLVPEVAENPALRSAAWSARAYADGYHIHDTFVFQSELESLGKWYRQLLGESIGKEHDVTGAVVHTGITPTVSVGSTDLHSVGQLYLGGPANVQTTFVSVAPQHALCVPTDRRFASIVEMITSQSTDAIGGAILAGTQAAYQKQRRPFVTVELAAVSAYELGAFMQWKMIEVMYLGQLLRVNPFDQPHVELYKTETKRILSHA